MTEDTDPDGMGAEVGTFCWFVVPVSSIDCEPEAVESTVCGSDNKETVVMVHTGEGIACNYTSLTSVKTGSCNCI